MNRQIARLGTALLVAYLVLFAQLNWLTLFNAEELQDNPENTRQLLRDFDAPRGTVISADGEILARTVPASPESPFERQREYPHGELYAHSVGYFSLNIGSDGVERTYNAELAGRTFELELQSLEDLFVDRERAGDLELTLRHDVQEVARAELGGRRGSVVALDPRTGGILAMWTFPSFDPNALAQHDTDGATAAQQLLEAHPDDPLLAKTYRERFFPGSTFKVVTGSAGVEADVVGPEEPVYPTSSEYVPPQTNRPIRNFGGSTCGGALLQVLRISCNTAFAEMGIDIGAEEMIETAESFGFNRDVPLDLPRPARSNFPTDFEQNLPALAQSAIGQNDVSATPLQMAMVAAAVANEGVIMEPHVLSEVRDADGEVVDRHDPDELWQAVSAPTAATMREAMLGVVRAGTATRLAIDGVEVGGKTGTAQLGTDPPRSHAWIIGFAGPPGQPAEVAVAVIVEGQEGASEQTGGRVAAPIARSVLERALQPVDPPPADAGTTTTTTGG